MTDQTKDTGKTKVNAVPEIAVHDLAVHERMGLGRFVDVELAEDPGTDAGRDLAADTFWELYKTNPKMSENIPASRQINKRLFDWIRSSDRYEEARADTMGDLATARVAAGFMARNLLGDAALEEAQKAQEQIEEKEKQANQARAEQALAESKEDEQAAEQAAARIAELESEMEQIAEQAIAGLGNLEENERAKAAIGSTLKEAAKQAKDVKNAMSAWGLSGGNAVRGNPEDAMEFLERNDEWIQEIALIAGRVKGIAANASRGNRPDGLIPHGIEYSRDPERILDEEQMRMDPDAPEIEQRLATLDYFERGLLSFERRDPAEEDGPFVVRTDRSGSMGNENMKRALGFSLGMCKHAQANGRAYSAGTFAGSNADVVTVTSSDGWRKHMEWAGQRAGGGTSFDVALTSGMDDLERLDAENADLVITTDGIALVSDEVAERWIEFSERTGSRLIYVPVIDGGFQGAGRLEELADVVIPMSGMIDTGKLARDVARII